MRNTKILIPIITILAAAIGAGLVYFALRADDGEPTTTSTAPARTTVTRDVSDIDSFEECAAAGFPVQETFPERCVADGKTFTREVVTRTETVTVTEPRPEFEQLSPTLRIKTLQSNDIVSSPLLVEGEAAAWYFEAEFPARLEDANGNLIAQGSARAQGDWMTAEFVPFEVTLTFSEPATATGTLILEKSNPRGEGPVESVEVPVRFGR